MTLRMRRPAHGGVHLACSAPFRSWGLGYPDRNSFIRPRRDSVKTRHNQKMWGGTLSSCLSAMPPVLHGPEGSAWARNLGVPLSDLRLLCGSIDGWGGESWSYGRFGFGVSFSF